MDWYYLRFLFKIWNYDAQLAVNDSVLDKIHKLVPDVTFLAEFYKRKFHSFILIPGLEPVLT